MQNLIAKTNSLIEKARRLAEANVKLRHDKSELEIEIKGLKATLENEVLKNNELNNKIKIIKLAQNISSGGVDESQEVAELKRKINEYIKEIDNCIAMLND